jgi:transcriptional regulator with PAS, ATPase and Fis domain
MCTEDWIATRDLGEPFASNPRPPKAGRLKDQERELIEKVLAKHDGNRTKAAVELGISRRTLLTRLKEIRG